MKNKFLSFLFLLSLFTVNNIYAFDLENIWRHPEIAEKNSIFIDVGKTITFQQIKDFGDYKFDLLVLDFRADYLLPLPLPFSLGTYFISPDPNLKFFGLRCGYHFDMDNPSLDVYVFYNQELGWLRNDILEKYNDTKVKPNKMDIRVGFRKYFNPRAKIGLCMESGFQFKSLVLLATIKIL